MAQAFGRIKGTTEWKPITLNGVEFEQRNVFLERAILKMGIQYPHIEYKVELDKGEEDE